ncbi:hypothetical protein [Pontibaca methylaminivorans]|uniref:hypothetical protein n=1 Tax=Pontibaca methylaminivorans TaxID=515897 RepID=UPI002FDB57A9
MPALLPEGDAESASRSVATSSSTFRPIRSIWPRRASMVASMRSKSIGLTR